MTEEKTDEHISPRELSVYNPEAPVTQYVDEQPGRLQAGLGRMRVGLQPYVRAVQDACTSVKVGVMSLYQAGQDTYEFLRDPPPGFLPRVGVITVSGLAGLVLARKGSRIKRIGVPLAFTAVGTAVCYPTQTVGVLKFTGKKVYSASSVVASVLKSKPKADVTVPPATLEPVTPNFDLEVKALLEPEPVEAAEGQGATSDTPSTTAEMIPTLTESVAPEPELAVVADVAESDVVCLPETETTPVITFEDVAPLADVALEPDDAPENLITLPESEPGIDASLSELAPTVKVASLPDVPQEDAPVSQVSPTADVPQPPDFALEEVTPETEISAEVASTVYTTPMNEVTSEMTEVMVAKLVPLFDVTSEEEATPVNEVIPGEDVSAAEVAPLSDVTQEEVGPTCGVALAEDALVAQVAPLPDVAPDVAPIELPPIPEVSPVAEVVTVSEVDAASELDLVVETSPVVEVAFLPDVAPEETPPAKVTLEVEVFSAEVAPAVDTTSSIVELAAVDETLSESVKPLAEPTPEAEVILLAAQLQSEPEAALELTHAAETVPDFEVGPEAVVEAALQPTNFVISELVPEEEATPVIPLPVEEPTLSALLPEEKDIPPSPPPAEPTLSPTALEAATPLPPIVEETGPLTPSVEEATPGPSTTDENTSITDVLDKAPRTLAVGLETTSSSPAETIPPTHAEDETPRLPSATEDTALLPPAVDDGKPPPAAVEETKPPAEVEEVPALKSPAMKGKPRFVPDPSLVDHGQAHPEDADMYSTRG
uniref:MICOS complex subunit n=2 Tax=Pygocentrus nattereri TaxID=42514 RepID=A0A3B4BSH6_PYGNA